MTRALTQSNPNTAHICACSLCFAFLRCAWLPCVALLYLSVVHLNSSTPSPSMTGNALPVRIPPLVASASPAVAGSQIAGGRPTRATKGRVPPTTQKAGGRASAGSGPSPAVLLEVDAPARPLGAPAWRPKRLGGGAASVISPGTATVLHMT